MKCKSLSMILFYKIYLVAFILLASSYTFSQGVAINSTGAIADSSAGLDIQFNNMGILIPRLTTAERNAISSPAEGLLIYNKTIKCFEFFDYGLWQTGNCAVCPLPIAAGSISGSAAVCLGQNSVSYSVPPITNATTYIWTYSGLGATISGSNNSITIDFSVLATSGDITVKGVNNCGSGPTSANFPVNINAVPSAPLAGIHNPSQTAIIWNWNSVSGAAGYKYNTTNDYNSAIDNGVNTSYIQTGLICNSSYTLYVWAYSLCGNSAPNILTQTSQICFTCGSNVTFMYQGSSVTYGSVTGQNGTCWLDRNLGASNAATAYNDAGAFGDLFQWGRGDDGHQLRNSSLTLNTSNIDNPGHSDFINGAYDWRNPQNDNLWQGASGINNPCPLGWRLPVITELENELYSWISPNIAGAFASNLKWTAAGFRFNSGQLYYINSEGDYWSSTIDANRSKDLYFNNSSSGTVSNDRVYGFSVRCIKDI